MRNSYSKIKFPFFGLRKAPFNIMYVKNGIAIQRQEMDEYITLDLKDKELSYFDRLLKIRSLEENPLLFDVTARSIEELLHANCAWGVDSEGNIFDLSKKEKVDITYRKVRQVNEDVLWVDRISYPFKIPKYLADEENLKNLWVGMVLLDFYYVIYDYSYFPQYKKQTRL